MSEPTRMVTSEGLQALEAELAQLEGEGRREVAQRIRTAREWGDLSENSEYHDAKNEQAHLETKIVRLRERIRESVVVEEGAGAADRVGLGSTVLVRDGDGVEQTWQIVSAHDADPRSGRLSSDSPLAAALIGKGKGDEAAVTLPRGERRLTILGVS